MNITEQRLWLGLKIGWVRKLGALVAIGVVAGAVVLIRLPLGTPHKGTHFAAPVRFETLPPSSTLPSSSECATWVRASQIPENKAMNRKFNQTTGHPVGDLFPSADNPRANPELAARIDGQFTGTTGQILRWAACKWGIDEDVVEAQAALESWWRQATLGDWGSDATACPPEHKPGADGVVGKCPESYGILQNRYPYERSSWPGVADSTAMNADTAYAIWRACYEGYEGWLNDVERVGHYSAGDAWGCVGRWFAGRWHTDAAEGYITKVRDYLSRRVWQQPDFQEP